MPFSEGVGTVRRLENAIAELRGVRQARVRGDAGSIDGVAVLVIPERDTAQVIDEVRAVVEREAGVSMSPEAIEVMRSNTKSPLSHRRKLSLISTERTPERFKARVVLELGGDTLVGESDSPSERSFEFRSIAKATLESLRKLLMGPVQLESVEVLTSGAHQFAVVALRKGREILIGSALVKVDYHDAVARATLDALNRHLSAPPAVETEPASVR